MFSGAVPPESPSGLHHQPAAELMSHPAPLPAFYNNFVILFHEIEHSKTQSLFKNRH